MHDALPRLRRDIDVMPSPIAEQPGLLLRDPFRYTGDVLVIPPAWVALLRCLDGAHSMLDAQVVMTRLAGGKMVAQSELQEFVTILSDRGFLDDEALARRVERAHDAFRASPVREETLAGSAYPLEREAIESLLDQRIDGTAKRSLCAPDEVWPLAIAAPHVSPEGGYASYSAAYALPENADEDIKTFVILGTSHYGAPERFGVTSKPFRTPLGTVEIDRDALSFFVERGGDAVVEEDYCHRTEHSIELQVLFLQYRLAQPFRILPILCGPFVDSLVRAVPPETLDGNARVFHALTELATKRPDLVWVLGVDMAHIGLRYGENEPARAYEGRMLEVREQDERRLERIAAGDAEGFYELVHPEGDALNWCGYAPIYTFLRAMHTRQVEGSVCSYEQWNIDEASVVTFAALHFREK